MFEKTAQVKDQSPLRRDAAAVSWPVKGVTASGSFEPLQEASDALRNRNGVCAIRSALGARERDGAGKQIHQSHIQSGFPQTAAGVVADFKTDCHPFLGRIHGRIMGEKAAHPQDLVVRKDRTLGDRCFFGAVVQHGHGVQQAEQASLAVQPFDKLHVVGRQVAAHLGSVGAGNGHAPSDVLLRMERGELLQAHVSFVQKAGNPAPAVSVVLFGGFADGVGFDKAAHPQVVILAECLFFDRKLGRFLSGLCPVQGVVRPVARGFGGPLPGSVFVPDPEPRTVFSLVNCGHVTIVSNHSKTQTNKG